MRRKLLVLPVLLVGLVGLTHGQPPDGGGGRRMMFGGPGGPPPDPEVIWGFVAKGQPTLNLNDPANARTRKRMEQEGTPIPADGILTKDQFKANWQASMAKRQAGGGGVPGAAPTPAFQPTPGGPPGGGRGGFDPSTLTDDQLRGFMQRYDKDGDGRISQPEAAASGSDTMSSWFTQFDANRDGFMDVTEYRAYNVARMQQRTAGRDQPPAAPFPQPGGPVPPFQPAPGQPPVPGSAPAEEARPEVLRFGKLPKGAPSWMLAPTKDNSAGLDANRDGQIGLYEWRRAGKRTAEFVEKDLNADGYLTYTEWKTFTEREIERQKAEDPDAEPAPAAVPSPGGPPAGNDRRDEKRDRRERKGPRNPFANKG